MRRGLAIAVWLFAAQAALATGVETTVGRFAEATNASERRLMDDAADGRLDEFSPLAAALVASGVANDDTLLSYQQKAAALANQLHRRIDPAAAPRQQVEAIFQFMHQQVLRGGYDLAATDLREVLDRGRYNCISATVLFNYLAGACGLDCRALEMPSHAMSRVRLIDGPVDVEMTCPRWFLMTEAEKSHGPAVSPTTIATAAAPDRGKAREVTAIQVAAMIYYNRGVELLAEKRFAQAAAANAKSLRLDPGNALARGNLLATLNNWSIEAGKQGRYAEAIRLLRQGLAMDAHFGPLLQNYVHTHRQWASDLCRNGRYDEAMDVLDRALAEMPSDGLRQTQVTLQQQVAKYATQSIRAAGMSQVPCTSGNDAVD